jgi:hypothetical protein
MGGTNRRIHELQSLLDVPPTTVSSSLSVSTLVAAVLIALGVSALLISSPSTIHAGSGYQPMGHPLQGGRRRRRGRGRIFASNKWIVVLAVGQNAAGDGVEFTVGEHSDGSGIDCVSHSFSILISANGPIPSPVRPHWLNTLAATVNRFTFFNHA